MKNQRGILRLHAALSATVVALLLSTIQVTQSRSAVGGHPIPKQTNLKSEQVKVDDSAPLGSTIPQRYQSEDFAHFADTHLRVEPFHSAKIISLDGTMCGMLSSSQLVTMDTGAKYCCHLRQNVHQQQGEIYTYHLARILGFSDLVTLTMATTVLFTDERFERVISEVASKAKWPHGSTLVCTEFVDGLSKVVLPVNLQAVVTERDYVDIEDSIGSSWSRMIVLDYLTGTTDRLVNLLTNFKYNAGILSSPVHNLALRPNGQLLLFDHETSFWVGYQFAKSNPETKKAQSFFVERLCNFDRDTLESLSRYCQQPKSLPAELYKAPTEFDKKTSFLVPPLSHDVIRELEGRLKWLCDRLSQHCHTKMNPIL